MQNAETVLGVLRDRGRRGLPLDEVYRQLYNPQLYLLAYGRLYSNKGAMTAGVDGETVDGMSMRKMERIIDAVRHERYRFRPVKRVHIPKKNGKTRPLGVPSWSDKLLGEVIRLLLEAYYEPQFSPRSHGFRPRRGCHTALSEVANTWTGTSWFIEGDIAQCFDRLDHSVMLTILGEKIHDNRFLRLMQNMLQAGYLQDWTYKATLSGVPQGGVVSPVLSNIYLHKLDTFVETVLIPEYTRGERRARDRAYHRVDEAITRARRRGDRIAVRALRQQQRSMPSKDYHDPGYRRLRYVRYADDTLLGFAGPKSEAEQIKQRLARFLRDELALELSPDKTLITHARSSAARFLGYEIIVQRDPNRIARGQRTLTSKVGLRVPLDVIKAKCRPHLKRGQPAHRTRLIHETDYTIVETFGTEYRGIVQYYLLAGDVWRLIRLGWVMQTSLLKTLAAKHRSTVPKMKAKYQARIDTPHGLRRCYEARVERDGKQPLVARFGGIPLKRQQHKTITDDRQPVRGPYPQKELIQRLQRGKCEMCDATGDIVVHQVRKLADLDTGQPQPEWAQLMAKRRRKTLVVCRPCHDRIHHRHPTGTTP